MMEMAETVRPLAELEATIERGLTTFVEVGQALLEIRERTLYPDQYDSFEAYCRGRWGFTDRRARQLIQAAEIGRILPIPPARASHAEELAPLKDDPEAVREVWAEVQEEHGDKVTAADVREAVDRRLGVPKPVMHLENDATWTPEFSRAVKGYPQEDPHAETWAPAGPPAEPPLGDLIDGTFVIPPRGLDPHAKAWHAAVAPAMYQRLDPDAVIATREPREIESGIDRIAESIAYLTRLMEAGRQVLGRSRLEVVR